MADKKRVKGVSVHRPIVYGSVATMIPVEERIMNPDHNMRWTVAVRSACSPSPQSEILKQRSIEEDVIGGQDDLSHFVKKVSFKLHDSYPNPLRTIDKPPYEINETGWGEFLIYIKIYFVSESGEKPLQFQHGLKLHNWLPDPVHLPQFQPWLESTVPAPRKPAASLSEAEQDPSGAPSGNSSHVAPPPPSSISSSTQSQPPASTSSTVHSLSDRKPDTTPSDPDPVNSATSNVTNQPKAIHSWQYDEVVFTEPNETFYQTLLSNPPSRLPERNRFPIEYVQQIGSKGESGEFSQEIEEKEFKKLSWARLKILIEIDQLRGKLIRSEKEMSEVKKSIQQML